MTYVDPYLLLEEVAQPYTERFDPELSYWENWYKLLTDCIWLPGGEIQYPIALISILANAKWLKTCPLTFCYGPPGCGKSTLAHLATCTRKSKKLNSVHGQIYSSADTFASLRDNLNAIYWMYAEEREKVNDGPLIAWDDIDLNTLADENIYRLLKVGYKLETGRIQKKGETGETEVYTVFGSKIFSSVQPIHLFPRYSELERRMLIIFHSHLEGDEFEPFPLDCLSFSGAYEEYCAFWGDIDRCYQVVKDLKNIKLRRRRDLPPEFKGTRWEICRELIPQLLAYGAIKRPGEGIEIFRRYWEYHDANAHLGRDAQGELIGRFMDPILEEMEKDRQARLSAGLSPSVVGVEAKKILTFLKEKSARGELDFSPTPNQVATQLNRYGYESFSVGKDMFWRKKK